MIFGLRTGPRRDQGQRIGKAPFMINYRVADLHALVAVLRDEGCDVPETTEESENGRFAWVMDPEGNKIGLREPAPGQ